jgi:hypothetical protein
MSSRVGALRGLLARLASASDVDWRLPGEVLGHLAEACSIDAPAAWQAGGPQQTGARP